MDISPETASTLSQIMLAQAQEVFCIKATSGTPPSNTPYFQMSGLNAMLHAMYTAHYIPVNCPWQQDKV